MLLVMRASALLTLLSVAAQAGAATLPRASSQNPDRVTQIEAQVQLLRRAVHGTRAHADWRAASSTGSDWLRVSVRLGGLHREFPLLSRLEDEEYTIRAKMRQQLAAWSGPNHALKAQLEFNLAEQVNQLEKATERTREIVGSFASEVPELKDPPLLGE
jgi:hypothetical protein